MEEEKLSPKDVATILKVVKIVVLSIVLILFVLGSFNIVKSNERGLKFTFGAISNKIVTPGIVFKIPIVQSVENVTVLPLELNYVIDVGKEGAITKDNQTVGANISVFYKYKEDQLVTMYTSFGEEKIRNVLITSFKECVKNVIGQYTIFTIPMNQEEIRGKCQKELVAKLSGYPIDVTELKITNYNWSDDFDKQIKFTMEKAQMVKQKEQELQITDLESQKLVKQAESEKSALIAKAEGEKEAVRLQAEAKVLEGEGIRKYNESIRTTSDFELKKMQLEIDRIKAERWDGQYVPNNNYLPIPYNYGNAQGK